MIWKGKYVSNNKMYFCDFYAVYSVMKVWVKKNPVSFNQSNETNFIVNP